MFWEHSHKHLLFWIIFSRICVWQSALKGRDSVSLQSRGKIYLLSCPINLMSLFRAKFRQICLQIIEIFQTWCAYTRACTESVWACICPCGTWRISNWHCSCCLLCCNKLFIDSDPEVLRLLPMFIKLKQVSLFVCKYGKISDPSWVLTSQFGFDFHWPNN